MYPSVISLSSYALLLLLRLLFFPFSNPPIVASPGLIKTTAPLNTRCTIAQLDDLPLRLKNNYNLFQMKVLLRDVQMATYFVFARSCQPESSNILLLLPPSLAKASAGTAVLPSRTPPLDQAKQVKIPHFLSFSFSSLYFFSLSLFLSYQKKL
jgi:hypothetical protein